jgi:PhnB protein
MKLVPYLHFNGQCEEALHFYEKVLGGSISGVFKFGASPMASHVGPDWADKAMHATMQIGDQTIYACDAPPPYFAQPQGFRICIDLTDVAEGERIFAALAEGGKVGMPIQETFWAHRYGDVIDRFGTPWMVNVSKPM